MNKAVYLLFMYICSSLAATTPLTTKKSGTTIKITTKELSTSTTSVKKPTTTTATTTIKTISKTTFTTPNTKPKTTFAAMNKTLTIAPIATKTTLRVTNTTLTTTSATTVKNTTEITTTSLSKILIEKVDYQINQTHLLTDIVEDNRLSLKRLISLISDIFSKNDNRIIKNHTNSEDEKQHIDNFRHADQVGGHDNDTLHVSFGTDAPADRYPWVVALNGDDKDRCGGTLIDDQHILTAAHCIGTTSTSVSLGSHLYDGGEKVKTDFYCLHKAYSIDSYRNDIAVIRLSKPVTVQLPRRVSTIKLCNPNSSISLLTASNTFNLWMVGWGKKSNEIEADELQEAQVTIAEKSMCKGSHRYMDMCVQSPSSTNPMGACKGDSGSGLFRQSILTNQWCVLGVARASNADKCAETQYTTYVRAATQEYVEWFRDVLDRSKTFDDLGDLDKCKSATIQQKFCRLYNNC